MTSVPTSTPTPDSDLEDRLRSHYRTVASSMPVPASVEFAPRRVRRPVWPAVAMGTLAVAALAVVGLVIATHDTSSNAPADAPSTGFPRLMPGWLPSGFELAGASDPGEQPQPASRQVIYAESPGSLMGRLLLVGVSATPISEYRVGDSTLAGLTVPGRETVASPREAGAQIAVDNGGTGTVVLVGRGFSAAELVDLATPMGTVSITPGSAPVLATPPAGLTLVSDEAGRAAIQSSELTYEAPPQPDGTVPSVGIAVYTDTSHGLESYVALAHPGAAETFDGHRAFRSVAPDGATRLAWEFRPGVVVEVRTEGLTDADLTRIARGLKTVSVDEWQAAVTGRVDTGVTPTTAGRPTTTQCTQQQAKPPATVVVPCGA